MVRNRLMSALTLILCASLLVACGGGESEATPTATLSGDQIQTAAVETFSAALTQTALAAPSNTPVPTLTASLTSAPFSTSAGAAISPGPTAAGTASCYRLAFVSDVSIPDDTPMTPGQVFTKTWKVTNTGACPWDAGFKFGFVSGDAMGGATFTLPSAVPPNATFDISVPMTTPSKAGTIRGDWRMSTAAGVAFGEIIYVQIVVGSSTGTATSGSGTPTTTKTAGAAIATSTTTSTATVTPTSTP